MLGIREGSLPGFCARSDRPQEQRFASMAPTFDPHFPMRRECLRRIKAERRSIGRAADTAAYPSLPRPRLSLPDVSDGFPGRCLRKLCWPRWQLQHGRYLPGEQPRDQHDLAGREFQRIVVDMRIVHTDLPEPCDSLIYARLPEQAESAVIPNVIFECEFGAGNQAHSHVGLADSGEASRQRFRKIRY
jgi:hypothetical protein